MKKIVILSNLISYTYNFRKEIIEQFIASGHDVTIVADNDDNPKHNYFLGMGCNMIDIPYNGKGTNISEDAKVLLRYTRILREIRPDVVFSFTIKPNLYGGFASLLNRRKYVPMITGLGELEKTGKLQALLLMMHKMVMPHAMCVLFQNRDNIEFFQSHGIRVKTAVQLPGSGINLQEHELYEYPEENGTINFGFVGRLTPAKGIEEYLAVAERMKADGIHANFLIAGKCDDQYKERVENLHNAGVIKYVGILSDTREFYKKIHCLVLPTYHPEGISNVLLESAAAGRPAICTNRTGCKEVVENGVNGFYCNAKDADNLYEIIHGFINLPWEQKKQMGLAGRTVVVDAFSRDLVVKQYADILQQV